MHCRKGQGSNMLLFFFCFFFAKSERKTELDDPMKIINHYNSKEEYRTIDTFCIPIGGINMKTLKIVVAMCFLTSGCIGSAVVRHKYVKNFPATQLYCVAVERFESSVACARVVLGNAFYRYGFDVDGGICCGCRTMDYSWTPSPEDTPRAGTLFVLGMFVLISFSSIFLYHFCSGGSFVFYILCES